MIAFNQTVRQIMSRLPELADVRTPISLAAKQMEKLACSSLLVADNGIAVGIITERDVMGALGAGVQPSQTVDAIMSRGPVSVLDTEEVHAAFHKMLMHDIRHLVIVDKTQQPVGLISEQDFRKYRGLEDFDGAITVEQAMSQSYLAAKQDDKVSVIARQLQTQKLSCAVIIEQGIPRGLVTERDMVRFFHMQMGEQNLAEVMTHPVIAVTNTEKLEAAVRTMRERRIRRLVVIDGQGRLSGILNEQDVLRHMEDGYVKMLQQMVVRQARELNESMFIAATNSMTEKILIKDIEFRYVFCNEGFARLINANQNDIVGRSDFDFLPRELAEEFRTEDLKVIQTGMPFSAERRIQLNGQSMWIRTHKAAMHNAQGKIIGIVVNYCDVTQIKKDELALQRHNWALRALSESNKAVVYARSEAAMLRGVCEAVVNSDAYLLAWIGWGEQDVAKTIRIAASAGNASSYLDGLQVSWGDGANGQGPTGTCIRTGRTVLNRGAQHNPDFSPWKDRAASLGIRASVAIPILIEGRVVAALMVYSNDENAFDSEEVGLFEDLVSNLGFGLASLRTQRNFDRSLVEKQIQVKKLDSALEGALVAVSATLEQRDPYTAGHEKRVADLAVMIGKELQLDEERLRCLHLAGIVHDLGKIQIPAEILTKSSRISKAEFALIKIHPEVGYDILKHIDFPWPIAEIIRQHHEYLDGSGYPHGLTAEQILFESRILTVADIVESMSSDRPYRPALGLDKAIEEICRLSGSKLDAEVVSACIEVLNRGDYIPASAEHRIQHEQPDYSLN